MAPKARADNVVIHRIEFQEKERELIEQLLASNLLKNSGAFLGGLGVPEFVKYMKVPTEVIGFLYSVATIAEALGIETGLPTPVDAVQWWEEYQAKSRQMAIDREACGGDVSVLGQIIDTLRVLLGADEEVLRSRWNCPEEGENPQGGASTGDASTDGLDGSNSKVPFGPGGPFGDGPI